MHVDDWLDDSMKRTLDALKNRDMAKLHYALTRMRAPAWQIDLHDGMPIPEMRIDIGGVAHRLTGASSMGPVVLEQIDTGVKHHVFIDQIQDHGPWYSV